MRIFAWSLVLLSTFIVAHPTWDRHQSSITTKHGVGDASMVTVGDGVSVTVDVGEASGVKVSVGVGVSVGVAVISGVAVGVSDGGGAASVSA